MYFVSAGWSSPEARRAHNPKVAGSNPAPAIRTAVTFWLLLFSLIGNSSGCVNFPFLLSEHLEIFLSGTLGTTSAFLCAIC